MIYKYLVLKFDDAKLFRPNKWTKDKIHDVFGSRKRDRFFIEPITQYQISNVIHVLFNQRPVPSIKECVYDKVDYYHEMALNSYLKYDDEFIQTNDKGETIKQTEVKFLNSPLFNSWKKTVSVNWRMIKILLGPENYEWLLESLKNIFNVNPDEYTFEDVVKIVNKVFHKHNLRAIKKVIFNADDSIPEIRFFQEIYERNLASVLIYKFEDPTSSYTTSAKDILKLTINNYIDKCEMYSGRIVIPLTKEDYEYLSESSKGVATILDGGMVWIENVLNPKYVTLEDYTPVNEISTKQEFIENL